MEPLTSKGRSLRAQFFRLSGVMSQYCIFYMHNITSYKHTRKVMKMEAESSAEMLLTIYEITR
jgi:hypothetical protein